MYEENRKFSWTDFLIKVIIFIIFILFVMWLLSLSTKGLSNSLNVLTDNIMSENINQMKEVGQEYFTIERLPSKVGEVEKITLQQMYDKHLILEIKDKDGNACSANDSYVSVEKLETEYEMKVYLDCGKDTKYIISKMGCTEICSNNECNITVEEEENTSNKGNTSSKKTEYQYSLSTNGTWGNYGAWSEWSTTKVTATDSKQVETKVEKIGTDYVTTATKTENVAYSSITCPSGYTLSNGTCYKTTSSTDKVNPTCPSTYNGYPLSYRNKFDCVYAKEVKSQEPTYEFIKQDNYNKMPEDTSTRHYEKVSVSDDLVCGNSCSKVTTYTVNVYEIVYKTEIVPVYRDATCKSGYTYNLSLDKCTKTSYGTTTTGAIKTCPVFTKENANKTGCIQTTIVDSIRTEYKDVVYYRFRTREYNESTNTIYKWSTSKNDKTLLDAGYKLTGKTR